MCLFDVSVRLLVVEDDLDDISTVPGAFSSEELFGLVIMLIAVEVEPALFLPGVYRRDDLSLPGPKVTGNQHHRA